MLLTSPSPAISGVFLFEIFAKEINWAMFSAHRLMLIMSMSTPMNANAMVWTKYESLIISHSPWVAGTRSAVLKPCQIRHYEETWPNQICVPLLESFNKILREYRNGDAWRHVKLSQSPGSWKWERRRLLRSWLSSWKGKPMLATSCEKSDTFLMRL